MNSLIPHTQRGPALYAYGSATPLEERSAFASWSLPADPRSPGTARRLAGGRLARWGFGDVETAVLLVSELVTNAVRYAPGPITLTVWLIDGLLRCEVTDTSPRPPTLRTPVLYDEGCRGLPLLDALACCWGVARTGDDCGDDCGEGLEGGGKAVWFELPTPG
ncbi:ATP-binding protein [Nonomuraea pusilla]|uniref:ATP-binding protein n=1 Tax=Nonomuraea pusilla TaxID=46177 RepID=UPI00332CE3C4